MRLNAFVDFKDYTFRSENYAFAELLQPLDSFNGLAL
jgi:hypothetical protein